MITIYALKPAFQKRLQPGLQLAARLGVTANQITVSAVLLSCLGGYLIRQSAHAPWLLLTMPSVLLLRMALNALDGMMARTYGQASALGEILNEVGDAVSDMALYLPLASLCADWTTAIYGVCVFVLLSLLSEFCGVLAKSMTGDRRYDGPMGKSDRALAISGLCVAAYFYPELIQAILPVLFAVLNGLLVLGCVNRLKPIVKGQ